MEEFWTRAHTVLADGIERFILAILIYIVGRLIIRYVRHLMEKSRILGKQDPSVRSFLKGFVNISLLVLLVASIVGVLGVPFSSIVAVLASAGVAVGMSLQGALGNLAGGIMVLIFKPFKVGDLVLVTNFKEEGVVKEITPLYTILENADTRRITVPNGLLMNSNITNYTADPNRRVELSFDCKCAEKGMDVETARKRILEAALADGDVLNAPAPQVFLSGAADGKYDFTLQCYVSNEAYERARHALYEAGVLALERE